MSSLNELIKKGLDDLKIQAKQENIDKLMLYLGTLKKWNEKINITAIKEDEAIVIKHFLDSLSVHNEIKTAKVILDVGTGGGFPGMVLAIFNPDKNFLLVDGVNKKITFLNEVKGKLGLKNVETYHAKVEDLKLENLVDVIISRAFSEVTKMIKLTTHLLKNGGEFLAMKGLKVEEEIENISDQKFEIKKLAVPFLAEERNLIKIYK